MGIPGFRILGAARGWRWNLRYPLLCSLLNVGVLNWPLGVGSWRCWVSVREVFSDIRVIGC